VIATLKVLAISVAENDSGAASYSSR
jgi:hypothetical protein